MEWYVIAVIGIAGLLFLLAIGMPIGLAMSMVGIGGLVLTGGTKMLLLIPHTLVERIDNFVFIAIPLFVLLGAIIESGRFDYDLYAAGEKWVGRLPGGLGIATVLALAWFGAVSGSSVATAAAMGKVGIPAMLERGYSKTFTVGIVCGASIGALIPPSILSIVYGLMTETSVGHLYIAQIGPSALLVGFFVMYVYLQARLRPEVAPLSRVPASWPDRLKSLPLMLPFILIFLIVTGTIYLGIATPTEAAAIASVIAILAVVFFRRFSTGSLRSAFLETMNVTGYIVLIMVGARLFTLFLGMNDVPQELAALTIQAGLSPIVLMMSIMMLCVFLGMLIDPLGMFALVVPVFFPAVVAAGFSPLLFGVLMVIQAEMGLLTPPVGIQTFVIAGIAKPYGITMGECFRGIVPFAIMMFLGILVLLAFPAIALWLPGTMLSR